jgi:hypothetical protein
MKDWKNIYEKYPQLFQDPKDIRLGNLNKVISCYKGWYSIVNNVCTVIDQHSKNKNKQQIKILQIKEKFGLITIYVQNADEYIQAIIDFAKIMSGDTCEYCGEQAEMNKLKTGWIKIICKKCKREIEKK